MACLLEYPHEAPRTQGSYRQGTHLGSSLHAWTGVCASVLGRFGRGQSMWGPRHRIWLQLSLVSEPGDVENAWHGGAANRALEASEIRAQLHLKLLGHLPGCQKQRGAEGLWLVSVGRTLQLQEACGHIQS